MGCSRSSNPGSAENTAKWVWCCTVGLVVIMASVFIWELNQWGYINDPYSAEPHTAVHAPPSVEAHLQWLNGGVDSHVVVWLFAGLCVMLTVPLSTYEIFMHLTHFCAPRQQQYTIRILWMVPIYAIDAWLSLRFKGLALYCDSLRDLYEAYVIYSFMMYLLSFFGEENQLEESLERQQQLGHLWPISYMLPEWEMGIRFADNCKKGVLQYVPVKLGCTICIVIFSWLGWYKDGEISVNSAYMYTAFITNCSQCWALYCLVLFYQGTKEELAPIKPFGKFVCVKAVVFFSWWQSLAIAALVHMDWIAETKKYSVQEIASSLQSFLICMEMLVAAIAHSFTFSYKEIATLQTNSDKSSGFFNALMVSTVPVDVVQELRQMDPLKDVQKAFERRSSSVSSSIEAKLPGKTVRREVLQLSGDHKL